MLGAALHVGYRLPLVEAFDAERTPLFMAEQGATLLGTALPMFQAYLAAQRGARRRTALPTAARLRGRRRTQDRRDRRRDPRRARRPRRGQQLGPDRVPDGHAAPASRTRRSRSRRPKVVRRPAWNCGSWPPTAASARPGEEGELRLRGPHLFLGYANPELDADALDEQGYFRTGDLGIVADTGHVTITGRLKDIIIRNAENISASEVEEVLQRHPSIADVAVIGLPDPRTGERACAVGHAGRRGDVAHAGRGGRALPARSGCAKQKVPEQLEIVDEIPRNAMAKIQKPALKKRFAPS